MHEHIGKVYGDLKILDVYRLESKNNYYFAKCECTICGAVGESRLIDIRRGKIKSCRNYNNRIKVENKTVKVFIHSGSVMLLDLEYYMENENKNYHIGGKGYPSQSTGYNGTHSLVHRSVMQAFEPQIIVDHKNGNKLDNRKENLRRCTISQNGMNQTIQKNRKIPKTSKYKGVKTCVYKTKTSYYARIKKNKIQYNLGRFDKEKDAARAYDCAALEMFGEYARTNKSLGLL